MKKKVYLGEWKRKCKLVPGLIVTPPPKALRIIPHTVLIPLHIKRKFEIYFLEREYGFAP